MNMKKILYWGLLFSLGIFSACSNDDDIKGEYGGIVYNGYTHQEIDESDPLAVFFRDELHKPYWDGYGNESKQYFIGVCILNLHKNKLSPNVL